MAPLACDLFDAAAVFASAAAENGINVFDGGESKPPDATPVAEAIEKLLNALPSSECAISDELRLRPPAETALIIANLMTYYRRR